MELPLSGCLARPDSASRLALQRRYDDRSCDDKRCDDRWPLSSRHDPTACGKSRAPCGSGPQRLKPLMKTRQLCSAEALLHPKSSATSSFSAACQVTQKSYKSTTFGRLVHFDLQLLIVKESRCAPKYLKKLAFTVWCNKCQEICHRSCIRAWVCLSAYHRAQSTVGFRRME